MKQPKQKVSQSRRRFLRNAGISSGVAAVAVSTPAVGLTETAEATPEQPQEGYHLTQHILDYYKTAAE